MDLNMANRQCCDLDIREYSTNKPWMFADFSNTTTSGFKADSVYAKIKGAKAIAFNNPIEGTMTCEFQCHPFKIYAMLSDGTIDTKAIVPVRKEVVCSTAGTVEVSGEAAISGTVFVYANGDFGGTAIEGTPTITTTEGSEKTSFTATTATDIAVDTTYLMCYLVQKTTGVSSISFNDTKIPKDYRITQETLDKDENGDLIPIKITAYKATVQRNLDLSFSSSGDPASIKLTFDVLRDKDGNVMDMIEETA
jgi:hypothetical protein